MGAVAGPFDAWLVLRGLKTLAVRMERHCDNAEAVAEFLLDHPGVTAVHYPGLPDHPNHDVAARQMTRFGGMVAFRVRGGEDVATKVCAETQLWTLGESLGGVESLIEHPGQMTHASRRRHRARGAGRTSSASPSASRTSRTSSPTSARRSTASPDACPAVLCVDVGSTFTKAVLVDVATGALARHGEPPDDGRHRRHGRRRCRARRPRGPRRAARRALCSSAGGGLRLAVVGYEREVTAEAGHRVGLSAGAQGRPRRERSDDGGRRRGAAGGAPRTSSSSSAAPTAATPTCCSTTPAASPAAAARRPGRRRGQRRGRAGRWPRCWRRPAGATS